MSTAATDRAQRAQEINGDAITQEGERWRVPSGTGLATYFVRLVPRAECSCPDYLYRRQPCKHIALVRDSQEASK